MNHSRYNLPNRFATTFAAIFCCLGTVAGQGTAPAAASAGTAVPDGARQVIASQQPTESEQTAAPANRSALPDPQQLLAGSRRMLSRQKSIVAKVRHRATIYDRELIGSGEYAQGPELARLLRYELRMQVDKRVVNLLQVADGRHLWISHQLKDEPEIQRIDIDRVLAAIDAGAGSAAAIDPQRQLGLGGLSQLLAAIEKDFEFNGVFKSQLGALSVYGIEGRWKKEALVAFDPKAAAEIQAGRRPSTDKLRAHVPDRVVIYLGIDDLFPYRFEFRRSVKAAEKGSANADAGIKGDDASKTLLVLEFFEVQFDVPIEERNFQYSPGSRRFADITDKFLTARTAVP